MVGLQELILILAILLIVIGPKKLPEMARGLGKVYQEFRKASASIMGMSNEMLSVSNDEDEGTRSIARIARSLGIDTEGRSTNQLLDEIERKMVKNEESADIPRK